MTEQVSVPKKRGRKAKVKTDTDNNMEKDNAPKDSAPKEPKVPKKRGRKPKGGKIIHIVDSQKGIRVPTPNIILHLKCSLSDLETNKMISSLSYNPDIENVESFQFYQTKTHDLNMLTIKDDNLENARHQGDNDNKDDNMDNMDNITANDDTKNIWKKLRTILIIHRYTYLNWN
jgi:hypothetical protein